MTTDYSEVADSQLDELESGSDTALYDDILRACEEVLDHPGKARSRSDTVSTENGIVFRVPVKGRYPWKVYWTYTPDGVCVEAVFRYE